MENHKQLDTMALELNPLLTAECFLYFPTEIDIKAGHGPKAWRRIFKGQLKLDEFETAEMAKFRQKLAQEKKVSLSEWWNDSETMRFQYATQFKYSQTLKAMLQHAEWRTHSLPIKYTHTIESFLSSGIIYMHGRDDKYRPIIIIDAGKIIQYEHLKIEDIIIGMTYFFEYMLKYAMLPGQIENWTVLFDLNSMGLTSLPISALKAMAKYLSNNYRSRMFATYVLNTPSSIFIPWSIVKGFLDEATISKIAFSKTHTTPKLFEHTDPSQIPIKYGGSASDPIQFWPPRVLDNSCYHTTPLVSKEQYYDMFQSNQLAGYVVCLNFLQERSQMTPMHKIDDSIVKMSVINVLNICSAFSPSKILGEFSNLECKGYFDIDSAPLVRKSQWEIQQNLNTQFFNETNQIDDYDLYFYHNTLGIPLDLAKKIKEYKPVSEEQNKQQKQNQQVLQQEFYSNILGIAIPLKQQQSGQYPQQLNIQQDPQQALVGQNSQQQTQGEVELINNGDYTGDSETADERTALGNGFNRYAASQIPNLKNNFRNETSAMERLNQVSPQKKYVSPQKF